MSVKKRIMDYGKYFTEAAKLRQPNLIRTLTEIYMRNPESLFFAGGLPNASLFPFKEITITYSNGMKKTLVDKDLTSALQYGPTQGHIPLLKTMTEFQKKYHSPKYNDWDIHIVAGSMEGCSKMFSMLIEPGESAMVQSPTYTGVLNSILPMQPDFIPLEMDEEGILAEEIERVCEEKIKNKKPLPKLLYVNPTGANPVGTVYSTERKRKIYELACRYDFIIIEDDAYFFLHFLEEQPKSFFSMDVQGRVVRLDSFSKFMSAGLRLGVVTGPKAFMDKLNLHKASTTLHPASLSQVLVCEVLANWSEDELNAHFKNIQKFYREKRDCMLKVIKKHFTGIAEWSEPKGGMFVWMKIKGMDDIYDLVIEKCAKQGVLVLPGHAFYADGTAPCSYIRLCYSQASEEDMEKGLSKIAAMIREETSKTQCKINAA
ncbi:kynurenine/alpha-aminoadipate aminotransferase, mitochondrial-like [Trichogramma pretiosum]|uniref:kynurenine/alpha-aminoadipate aminotransferase, mitochondrial-like n=1 Tax=Trichogramma pretiosum TaxID=7493 RepID=UPI0006C94BE0|nr:kynurenine/alpha-aminoadipate aminotransferase, mitochondrial-like [Trichogramma pretiosum]